MSDFLVHAVYRQYVVLVRGEHFTLSELGETFLGADCLQLNWFEPECAEQYPPMAFNKPSKLENKLICSRLRVLHGTDKLSEIKGFDAGGVFNLPRERGMFAPIKENGLITELRFIKL